jgi:hypothetical protein
MDVNIHYYFLQNRNKTSSSVQTRCQESARGPILPWVPGCSYKNCEERRSPWSLCRLTRQSHRWRSPGFWFQLLAFAAPSSIHSFANVAAATGYSHWIGDSVWSFGFVNAVYSSTNKCDNSTTNCSEGGEKGTCRHSEWCNSRQWRGNWALERNESIAIALFKSSNYVWSGWAIKSHLISRPKEPQTMGKFLWVFARIILV